MYSAQGVDKLPHKLYDQLYRPMNMSLPIASVKAWVQQEKFCQDEHSRKSPISADGASLWNWSFLWKEVLLQKSGGPGSTTSSPCTLNTKTNKIWKVINFRDIFIINEKAWLANWLLSVHISYSPNTDAVKIWMLWSLYHTHCLNPSLIILYFLL